MEFKFIKYTISKEGTNVTLYSPVHASNVYRYSHVVSTFTPPTKEGEEPQEPKTVEFLGIESTVIAETTERVPLKVMKRAKQTKTDEYFYVEELAKSMKPILEKVENKEEIDKVVAWLEEHCI